MSLICSNREGKEGDDVVLHHSDNVAKAWTEHLYPRRKEHGIMKANLRKLIGTAVLGLVLFSNSLPAWAGQQLLPQVTVGPSSASGSMVGARYSSDSQQYIGCVFYQETLTSGFVRCSARDKTGRSFSCSSYDPRWATVVKTIADSAVISFEGNDGGSCTSLVIENHSSHLR
jgi:hypothetical protein